VSASPIGDEKIETFVIDFPDSKGLIREELISIEGSLGGFVFRTGNTMGGLLQTCFSQD